MATVKLRAWSKKTGSGSPAVARALGIFGVPESDSFSGFTLEVGYSVSSVSVGVVVSRSGQVLRRYRSNWGTVKAARP
jgi:hypothetical protein